MPESIHLAFCCARAAVDLPLFIRAQANPVVRRYQRKPTRGLPKLVRADVVAFEQFVQALTRQSSLPRGAGDHAVVFLQ